jgi:hypothetical protein
MIVSQHLVLFFVGRAMKISVSYRREAPLFLPAPENESSGPCLRIVSTNPEKGSPPCNSTP